MNTAPKICPIRAVAFEISSALIFGATGEQPEVQPPFCGRGQCAMWREHKVMNAQGETPGYCGLAGKKV
ncbi:MAG: hypothetical protein AAF468_22275 [Pseudomonadota bacterium]